MRFFLRTLLYIACAPTDVLGFIAAMLLRVLWGKSLHVHKGALVCQLDRSKWFERRLFSGWGGSTISPHVIIVGDGDFHVLPHELVHMEQFEAAALLGAVFTIVGFVLQLPTWVAVLPVVFNVWATALAAYTTAVLRGEDFYRGAHIEEAAYDHANPPGTP